MKFHTRTLGCKMNYLDSARLTAALQMAGHTLTPNEAEAEVVFVNSCTVTGRADQQSRQESRQIERMEKQLVVFGCGPKVDLEKWRIAFPDALIFRDDEELFRHFGAEDEVSYFPLSSRTRLPIAIQTGCDNHCTFCITRIARDKSRDFPLEAILRQIKRAHFADIKEVVLTGIQLAGWGCLDSEKYPETSKLSELLRSILSETSIARVRISSLGPQFLTDDFFAVLADSRICDHLHLSVQSGSPAVLQKMNRGHGAKEIYKIAEKARKVRPDVALTADFIVGFPGETEADFQMTMEMARQVGFSKLHVFPFSPRLGTGAAKFPNQISAAEKRRRAKLLRELGNSLREEFLRGQIGKTKTVLFEEKVSGLSSNYIRVRRENMASGGMREIVLTAENIIREISE